MKYSELEKYYLCGIGTNGKVEKFRVGTYDRNKKCFNFSNGAYSVSELFTTPSAGNACCVISAVCLQELDDKGFLYEPIESGGE